MFETQSKINIYLNMALLQILKCPKSMMYTSGWTKSQMLVMGLGIGVKTGPGVY